MPTREPAAGLALPTFLLGFSLSGFLDGILLHQILQWHHLLSAIRGDDIRFQVLADGYFHLAMYAVALAGLWLLWRRRRRLGCADGVRGALVPFLLGFGAWHVVDAVLSHWVLGIHRIKWDAPNPLVWDIGWLVAFGLAPIVLALLLRRRGGRVPPAAAAGLAALVIGAGVWAARPPLDPSPGQAAGQSADRALTTIVFAPGVSAGEALSRAMGAGDALVWSDGRGVFVVTGVARAAVPGLYARGALLVSGAATAPGCFAWTDTTR